MPPLKPHRFAPSGLPCVAADVARQTKSVSTPSSPPIGFRNSCRRVPESLIQIGACLFGALSDRCVFTGPSVRKLPLSHQPPRNEDPLLYCVRTQFVWFMQDSSQTKFCSCVYDVASEKSTVVQSISVRYRLPWSGSLECIRKAIQGRQASIAT